MGLHTIIIDPTHHHRMFVAIVAHTISSSHTISVAFPGGWPTCIAWILYEAANTFKLGSHGDVDGKSRT